MVNGLNPLSMFGVHTAFGEGYGIGIWSFIAYIYMILISPLWITAIGNMVDKNCELSAAFRLGEIYNKIRNIGWDKTRSMVYNIWNYLLFHYNKHR